MTRLIYEIAADIEKHWPNVFFGARPYLDAMKEIRLIEDMYLYDTADSVVRYFLSNAANWRGENARRVKAELKDMLK